VIDTLLLPDGRSIAISVDEDTDQVLVDGDLSGLSPVAAGMLAAGLERASVIAGQRAARRRLKAVGEVPRMTIEQVAAAIDAGIAAQPPEPIDAGNHAPGCGHLRNWRFCDCRGLP
jgi:hypothetical protein